MLKDTYAEDELVRLLGETYGEIEDVYFVNYDPFEIIKRFD